MRSQERSPFCVKFESKNKSATHDDRNAAIGIDTKLTKSNISYAVEKKQ